MRYRKVIFIVLLFPLALMAMTVVMDAVEDWLSSRRVPTGRPGLAGAARARRAVTGAVRTAGETMPSAPASLPPSWPALAPVPPAAVPPPSLAPGTWPADGQQSIPAQYRPAAARAAGWS
ncbi:hypothetical protein [Parafrankia sp. FMc2]|uniref:hypothetical protein n=1 Tax=Parafrankia sp. FMc2 TaxID=3233196 RepID=UPI0034D77EE2